MLSPSTYWLLLLVVTLFACGRGGRDERAVAVIIVIASIATMLVYVPAPDAYSHVETGIFLVDVAALVAFVAVALLSSRFWPLWVAGFQLTSVTSHMIMAADWDLMPRIYAAAERFWIYPMLLTLVVGTCRAHRHKSGRQQAVMAI